MTKDLEETLAELGPGYREVVDRLVWAYRKPESQKPALANKRGALAGWSAAYLVAASLLIFLGLGLLFREPTIRGTSEAHLVYTVAYAPSESALATILASQRSDGSWDNDFITRQNAAALRHEAKPEMQIAYKKAVRYLRSRGLKPLSDAELKVRGDEAARLLAKI